MKIYVEYLSLRILLHSVLKELLEGEARNNKAKICYYIDATKPGRIVASLLGKLFGFQIKKLVFEMRYIKDERGESIRIRIPRKDLFEIQRQIVNSDAYRALYRNEWKQTKVDDYIRKGLITINIMDVKSTSRVLFVINVVAWHWKQTDGLQGKLLLTKRAWWDIYKQYALSAGIELKRIGIKRTFSGGGVCLKGILRRYPRLYFSLRSMRTGNFKIKFVKTDPSIPKMYLYGRGDVNLENNGYHSDFFWLLNSIFPASNVVYDAHSEEEKLALEHHGIIVHNGYVRYRDDDNERKVPLPKKSRIYEEEFRGIEYLIRQYNCSKAYWVSFFKTYGIKVYLTWYKYENDHMVIADAIRDVGGIFVTWQMAFDGYRSIECVTNADIVFSFSRWSEKIERQLNSKIKYHVITGFLKDYAPPLLIKEAKDLRTKLQSMGAEKIVLVIDENSNDDPRWHTGHILQQDNYSFILGKILDTPWLGVVFKPKIAKTLRRRLGKVSDLLAEAEKTGRCYVYDTSWRYTTSASPILAGLSADVCIHGHLCAGTAALECALEGIPTLLIDREGCPDSKFWELPEGKVVFRNWPEAIDALMDHFRRPGGIQGFGDWMEIIDEFDPFRDGKAANRMGTYLHWLVQGYERGLDRDVIMADAARRYCKIWGSDKVVSINS